MAGNFGTFKGRGGGKSGPGNSSSAASSSQPQAGGNAANTAGGQPPNKRPRKSGGSFLASHPTNKQAPGTLGPQPPPRPDQGTLPTGTSNLGAPAQAGGGTQQWPSPSPFDGVAPVPALTSTGIFSGAGLSKSAIADIFKDDPTPPASPTKTDKHTIEEIQKLVDNAKEDEDLLALLKDRADKARGAQTQEQRKTQLRKLVRPWFKAGLSYKGPKRPGLFLDDGTRNPARPLKGSGSGLPPETIPAGPGAATTGPERPSSTAGNPPSDNNKAATAPGTKAPKGPGNPPSNTTKAPAAPGTKAPKGTGNPPSNTTKAPAAPGTKAPKGPGKKDSTGTENRPPKSSGKNTSKGPGSSPLRQPPLTVDGPTVSNPELPTGTSSGTDGAGWRRRDDLFDDGVMDAAGIKIPSSGETVNALPKLPSSIDYDTENWEQQ